MRIIAKPYNWGPDNQISIRIYRYVTSRLLNLAFYKILRQIQGCLRWVRLSFYDVHHTIIVSFFKLSEQSKLDTAITTYLDISLNAKFYNLPATRYTVIVFTGSDHRHARPGDATWQASFLDTWEFSTIYYAHTHARAVYWKFACRVAVRSSWLGS